MMFASPLIITHWTQLFANLQVSRSPFYQKTCYCLVYSTNRNLTPFGRMNRNPNNVVLPESSLSLTTSSSPSTSNSVQLSLWLLPPQGGRFERHMRKQIQQYSRSGPGAIPGSSKAFDPHVTVVGGFTCMEDEVNQIAHMLQQSLSDFGRFRMSLQQEDNNEQHCCKVKGHAQLAWSQALYLPMKESDRFTSLCSLARQLLQLDNEKSLFAPPACEPHLSLCYTRQVLDATFLLEAGANLQNMMLNNSENENNENDDPFSFMAETLALYKTDPSSVKGVVHWRKMGTVIDLLGRPAGEQGITTTTKARTTTTTSR